jgi:hypothetical protein
VTRLGRNPLPSSIECMPHVPVSFDTPRPKKEPQSTFSGHFLDAPPRGALLNLPGTPRYPAIGDSIECFSVDGHSQTKQDNHLGLLELDSSLSPTKWLRQESFSSFPARSRPSSLSDPNRISSFRSRSPSSELPTDGDGHQAFQEGTKPRDDQDEKSVKGQYYGFRSYCDFPIRTDIDRSPEDVGNYPFHESSSLSKGPGKETFYEATSVMKSPQTEAFSQSNSFFSPSGKATDLKIERTATTTQDDLLFQPTLEMSVDEFTSNLQENSDADPRAMVNSIYSSGASMKHEASDGIQMEASRNLYNSRKQELILEIEGVDREITDVESLLKELDSEVSVLAEEDLARSNVHKSRIVFETLADIHTRGPISHRNLENSDARLGEEPISDIYRTFQDFRMDDTMHTKLSKYLCWNWQRTLKRELNLTEEFKALSARWKRAVRKVEKRLNQKVPPPTIYGSREMFQSSSILNRSTIHLPGRRVRGDIVHSEAELELVMLQLAEEERVNPDRRFLTTLADVPPMILDEDSIRSEVFLSVNGLIDDCDKLLESKARVWWREEEEKIFIEKYLEFPKSFGRIATYLHDKTAGDCVEFYYHNKKRLNLKRLVRKDLIRKKKLSQRFPEVDLDRDMAGPKASELHNFADDTPVETGSLTNYGHDGVDQNLRDPEKAPAIQEEHAPRNVGEGSLNTIRTFGFSPSIRPEREKIHNIHEVHYQQRFQSVPTSMGAEEIKNDKFLHITSAEEFPLVEASSSERESKAPTETSHGPFQRVSLPNPNGNRTLSAWSDEECRLFMKYFPEYGGDWDRLAELITTKSKSQIEHFSQIYRRELDSRDPRLAAHLTQMAGPNVYLNRHDPNLYGEPSSPNEPANLDPSNNCIPLQFAPFSPFPHMPARFPTNSPIVPYNVMPRPLHSAHYGYSTPLTFPNFYGAFMVPMIPFGMYNPPFGSEIYARSYWGMASQNAAAQPFIGGQTVSLSPEVCSSTEMVSDPSQNSQNIPDKTQTESTSDDTTNT